MVNDAAALAGTSREAMLVREMEVPVPWVGFIVGGGICLPLKRTVSQFSYPENWMVDGWLEDVYLYIFPIWDPLGLFSGAYLLLVSGSVD